MKRIIALATLAVITVLSLASCSLFGVQTTESETDATTKAPVETVKPADVAKDIDLKKADPSTDDVKFSFDDEGRVITAEYKSGDVEYLLCYNYRDGRVEVYLFGAEEVVDFKQYKPSADFDKSLGFIEVDGYYFNGFKSLEEIPVETKAPETTKAADSESESSPESESASETETETETVTETESDTETAE